MNKINVLVLPSDRVGVGKYRSLDPHIKLQELYPDDFFVEIDYDPKISDESYWEKYHIIHIHRSIGRDYDNTPKIIKNLRDKGKIVIVDIDDYWMPSKNHPIHALITTHKIHEKIIANLKSASYVMTTTKLFASHIRNHNKNVVIFPNAIDPDENQFKEPTIPSDKLRIGWLGGSSHIADMGLLSSSMAKLSSSRNKLQFYLCGFDTRGSVTEINQQTNQQKQRQIKPKETVWFKYEKIVTDNYYGLDSKYIDYLMEFREGMFDGEEDLPYRRVWTRPVTSYAKNYAKFDVSLAPLVKDTFNVCKSQLKVIEAGFYKKAIIASNVGPYTIDINHTYSSKDGFGNGNGLLVDENRNHSDWAKYIKVLMHNPSYAEDLGNRLYETVKDTYNLNKVTKDRAEFYKSILK